MSDNSKKKGSGSAGAPPDKNEKEFLSIDSLLEELASEEENIADSFPDDFDSFDDDIGDDPDALSDDFDDFDDIDDFDDFDGEQDSIEAADEPEAEDITEFETYDFKAEDIWGDDTARSSSGKPGTFFGRLQGGKDGKSNLIPLLIIALLVVIIVILLMQNCTCGSTQQDDWFDASAIEGTLPGKSPEEIQSMLNQIVEEGMFNVSIAPTIVFENAQAEGQARIENIPANHYNMSVKITLDKTSETIYESKGIRPGQYIEYIRLQKELRPGEYAATALFSAYDAEDLSEQGRVAVKITVVVE